MEKIKEKLLETYSANDYGWNEDTDVWEIIDDLLNSFCENACLFDAGITIEELEELVNASYEKHIEEEKKEYDKKGVKVTFYTAEEMIEVFRNDYNDYLEYFGH